MTGWRTALGAILASAFLLLNVGSAQAYLATTGSGGASTQLPTLSGPSTVSVSQSGAAVSVSWSAVTVSSGTAVQGYKVTRSDGVTVCGNPTLVTSLSCTDNGPPAGTYAYTVDAVYNSWNGTTTSSPFTVLTAPTITAGPAKPASSTSASFSFSGGSGTAYQCQIDGGGYSACTAPASYAALSDGSHTFSVEAVRGGSSGPAAVYTWLVDTVAPTQTLSLAAGTTGAYIGGSNLYVNGNSAGSFQLVDTVSDAGSGPASATFPAVTKTGWTHASETVTTPSGGPYVSSAFTWTANPQVNDGYVVSSADAAGNTTSTKINLKVDSAAPTGGALTVNGTAAAAGGSTSQATNSTSFPINKRTDYSDGGSGVQSSVLSVQSESLSATGACGAPGSGGPFTSPTTITGSTQPAGIAAGYCYLYTLTGTDNVGNVASVSTTVVDNALSFSVTAQPATAIAGTSSAVALTAIKNGSVDTSYSGAALTWSGAANSPSGNAPALPTNPTWAAGVAAFTITLVDAQTATLTVTDGTRSTTFAAITVGPGVATNVAWTSPSSSHTPLPSPCLFGCAFGTGFGSSGTFNAYVSITDSQGNIETNVGAGQSVTVTLGGSAKGTVSPTTLAIPAAGPATSATQLLYTSVAQGNYSDTLTASSGAYTSATASFSR